MRTEPASGAPALVGAVRTWALEQRPDLREAVQTFWGRLALVAVFTALAQWGGLSAVYVLAAAAFAYAPAQRTWIALGAAAVALVRQSDPWLERLAPVLAESALAPSQAKALTLAMLALYLAAAWAALAWTHRQPDFFLARRPVLLQASACLLLAVLASLAALPGALRLAVWVLLCVAGTQMWMLAYALQDRRTQVPVALAQQMAWFHPFWRASMGSLAPTPFGKGAAFLRRHQAQTGDELALTQIKALKLLTWALVLAGLNAGLLQLAGWLGVPPAEAVFEAFVAGRPHAWGLNWASLIVSAANAALALAVVGHKIVAVARLAGFRLPRNTWRPLEARTLAEFWNRYYYYFKELLVDFFFYPTFFRLFRRHPRLRVFVATFMAAGVGNALFHFLRDIHLVAILGWRDAVAGYLGNVFYCTVLAVGIGVSQARLSAGRRLGNGWLARLWQGLCVWGFFVVLRVFGEESRHFSFSDRLGFFFNLWGM